MELQLDATITVFIDLQDQLNHLQKTVNRRTCSDKQQARKPLPTT
jgi:hypothetical protein